MPQGHEVNRRPGGHLMAARTSRDLRIGVLIIGRSLGMKPTAIFPLRKIIAHDTTDQHGEMRAWLAVIGLSRSKYVMQSRRLLGQTHTP